MNGAYYVGAVGLQAQQRALEILSNNIANINTPAFKRSDVRFAEVLAMRPDPDVVPADGDAAMATAGVMARPAVALDETGAVEQTGHAMDLAINGRGFIELMGPDGQTLLWRGGALKRGEDGALLAAESGFALKAAITVPADATGITIAADGTVTAAVNDGSAPAELGQIMLVEPSDLAGLTALDGGLFKPADHANLQAARAGEDGLGTLAQGAIEHSNVDMTSEMVQLMLVQRAYAANAQIVQAADQLMGLANGLRR